MKASTKHDRIGFPLALIFIFGPFASPSVALSQTADRLDANQQSIALIPSFEAKRLLRLLDSAYACRSATLRHMFFDRWLVESINLQRSFTTPKPPMSEVNAIFYDLYTPDTATLERRIDRIRNDTSGTPKIRTEELIDFAEITQGSPGDAGFIVVQADIRYRVRGTWDTADICESGKGKGSWVTVDFYPQIPMQGKRVLYLTAKYEKILDDFLSYDYPSPLMALHPGSSDGVQDRMKWLRPEISISVLHWGGWQYLTYPVVSSMEFNSGMTRARVTYRDSWCTGGEVCYAKSEGKWTRQETVSSWIE